MAGKAYELIFSLIYLKTIVYCLPGSHHLSRTLGVEHLSKANHESSMTLYRSMSQAETLSGPLSLEGYICFRTTTARTWLRNFGRPIASFRTRNFREPIGRLELRDQVLRALVLVLGN